MPKIKGILERYDPKPDKHPDLKAILITDEKGQEQWFTTFGNFQNIPIGSMVEAEYRVKGENRNITKINLLELRTLGPQKPSPRNENIDKRTALLTATNLIIERLKTIKSDIDDSITTDTILEIADKFYKWLKE